MGILKLNKLKRFIHSFSRWVVKFKYAYKLFKFGLIYSQSRISDRIDQFIWDEFISFVKPHYLEIRKISDSGESQFYKEVIEVYDWYTSGINSEIEEQKELFKQWSSFKPLKVNLIDGELSIYNMEKDDSINRVKREEIANIRQRYEQSVSNLNNKYLLYTNYIYSNLKNFNFPF